MRVIIILFMLGLLMSTMQAQNKRDYYWPFGKDQDNKEGVQASAFDFNVRPFAVQEREGELEFDQNNASICDEAGNLLFYTNGCAVANRLHQIMPNGDSINAGEFFDILWLGDCGNGYPGRQDVIILPDPSNREGYYLIHEIISFHPNGQNIIADTLLYSYISMSEDNGLGDVIYKNRSIDIDEYLSGYQSAINHSNGIDWWVLIADKVKGFDLFQIDEQGFSFVEKLDVGPAYHWNASASGDSRFSPDGTKYAYFNEFDGLQLYDFDRTEGVLDHIGSIDLIDTVNWWFATCEWSPSSQFLYLIKSDSIWQLDTHIDPLEDGLEFIAAHNGVLDPLSTRFFKSALGPDCRIYIRPGSGSNSFHVINKPDEKGIACDLVQQGIRLPYISATGSFPNFPRFRVDEEEKCDPSIVSIVGETVWWRRELTVYPSPTTGPVTVEIPESKRGQLYVVDMQGQVVLHKNVEILIGELELSLGGLPSAIYSVEFIADDSTDRVVWTKRVVVVE